MSKLRNLNIALLFILGCASVDQYQKHSLVDQILKPREGFKGLTNRYCSEYVDDECKTWSVEERLFEDREFQETANKLNFLCNVGGKRYKICKESEGDKPGLCRVSYESCFLCKPKKIVQWIDAKAYKFLLDSNVKCKSNTTYPYLGDSP